MSAYYWSEEQDKQLRALWAEGLSASQIGVRIGCTKNSVIGRINRLGGIERRKSPIKTFSPAQFPYAQVETLLRNGWPVMRVAAQFRVDHNRVRLIRDSIGVAPYTPKKREAEKKVVRAVIDVPRVEAAPRQKMQPPRIGKPRQCEYLSGDEKPWIRCEGTCVAGMSWCHTHALLCTTTYGRAAA